MIILNKENKEDKYLGRNRRNSRKNKNINHDETKKITNILLKIIFVLAILFLVIVLLNIAKILIHDRSGQNRNDALRDTEGDRKEGKAEKEGRWHFAGGDGAADRNVALLCQAFRADWRDFLLQPDKDCRSTL